MTDSSEQYRPIDCSLYDYIELACVHHYRVRIQLSVRYAGDEADASISGYAQTTRVVKEEGEFLQLKVDEHIGSVRLDHIVSMEALDDGASFGVIFFKL